MYCENHFIPIAIDPPAGKWLLLFPNVNPKFHMVSDFEMRGWMAIVEPTDNFKWQRRRKHRPECLLLLLSFWFGLWKVFGKCYLCTNCNSLCMEVVGAALPPSSPCRRERWPIFNGFRVARGKWYPVKLWHMMANIKFIGGRKTIERFSLYVQSFIESYW